MEGEYVKYYEIYRYCENGSHKYWPIFMAVVEYIIDIIQSCSFEVGIFKVSIKVVSSVCHPDIL